MKWTRDPGSDCGQDGNIEELHHRTDYIPKPELRA